MIVIRMPARRFRVIWVDEMAMAIPGMPGDATKAVRSKAGR